MTAMKPVGISFSLRLDNEALTLESVVNSLVNGMQIPYEILLLDDGVSTDNTSQIASCLAEKNMTVQHIVISSISDDSVDVDIRYRWRMAWDGDKPATSLFLEKLHALPFASTDVMRLEIPMHYGRALIFRSDGPKHIFLL